MSTWQAASVAPRVEGSVLAEIAADLLFLEDWSISFSILKNWPSQAPSSLKSWITKGLPICSRLVSHSEKG